MADNNALRRYAYSGNATLADLPYLYAQYGQGINRIPAGAQGMGGGSNQDGAITPPSLRFESYDAPQQAPSSGDSGGFALPEIIQQYFPDFDFKSGGAGMGGGGGGMGMGRGPGSNAPSVASQGFGNDVAAAFDAFSRAPMTPVGLMDTLAGLAFADNPNDMPSAWGALMDALGFGDGSDRSGGYGNNAPTGGMTTVDPNTGAPQSTNPALNANTIAGVNLGQFGIGAPTSSYGPSSSRGGGNAGGGRGSNAGSNAGRGGAGPSGKSGPGGNRR